MRLYFNKWTVIALTVLSLLFLSQPVSAQIQIGEYEGWKVSTSGSLSVYAVSAGWDDCEEPVAANGCGGAFGGVPESTFRIMGGYFPAQLRFHINAPEVDGINVSAHFGTATFTAGNKSGSGGNSWQARIADLQVAGGFGTVAIGRNWSIFNTQSLVHDTGSWYGVGRVLSPDQSAPGWGHIGTGYLWTDFASRIAYTTPTFAGLTFNIGVFDPLEMDISPDVQEFSLSGGNAVYDPTPNDTSTYENANDTITAPLETATPRIEAELAYTNSFGPLGLDVWLGFMQQGIEISDTGLELAEEKIEALPGDETITDETSVDITGFDAGLELRAFGLALTGSVTESEGTGQLGLIGGGLNCNLVTGCFADSWSQMFVELDYTISDFTFGVNYGQGVRDEAEANEGNFSERTQTLTMAFVHYQFRPYMRWVLEYNTFEATETDANDEENTVESNTIIAIGTSVMF